MNEVQSKDDHAVVPRGRDHRYLARRYCRVLEHEIMMPSNTTYTRLAVSLNYSWIDKKQEALLLQRKCHASRSQASSRSETRSYSVSGFDPHPDSDFDLYLHFDQTRILTSGQIHRNCLQIFPTTYLRIILRQKLRCLKTTLRHTLCCYILATCDEQ